MLSLLAGGALVARPLPRNDDVAAAVKDAVRPRARPAGRRLGRPLLYMLAAVRHWRSLYRLWSAPEGRLLEILVVARPEIWSLLRVRFLTSRWRTAERFTRVIDHCETVERIGAPFDLLPNQNAELTTLDEIAPGYRLVLDSPRWLMLDGLLALSLFDGRDRLYSVAFILCSEAGGLTAYVGGVQGRRGTDTLDRYRAFTRASHGIRPADMVVEMLRAVCAEIGVVRLRAVAHGRRHLHGPYASHRADFSDPVTFDYDALWRERGGTMMPDGFFDLPLRYSPRPLAEVPPRKRGERRRRYAMLDAIHARLTDRLQSPRTIPIHAHEPINWP